MWPYASRGSRFMGEVNEISPSTLEAEDFITNAVSIKLWLPEKLVAAIDVLCEQHDASRPDLLRWILFEHVFGRLELTHLKRRMSARLKLELQDLADAARQPLSDYLRAVLARHLLGERFFREWQAALAKANAEAARHESDTVVAR